VRTRRRRQAALIAVLIATALLGVLSGYLLYTSTLRDQGAQPTDAPSLISPGAVISLDVNIESDDGTSVTLAWTDPSGGTQSFVAVQVDPNPDLSRTEVVPPGGARKTVTFFGLARDRNYCFRVGVVQSATEVTFSPEVCTTR
jgi:hypothetical protein